MLKYMYNMWFIEKYTGPQNENNLWRAVTSQGADVGLNYCVMTLWHTFSFLRLSLWPAANESCLTRSAFWNTLPTKDELILQHYRLRFILDKRWTLCSTEGYLVQGDELKFVDSKDDQYVFFLDIKCTSQSIGRSSWSCWVAPSPSYLLTYSQI